MGMTPPPLARIGDRFDELEEELNEVFADARLTARERARVWSRLRQVGGMLSCQEVYDRAADSLRRNGMVSDQTARLLREAHNAAEVERAGWRVIDGGRNDDPSGPAAAQAA